MRKFIPWVVCLSLILASCNPKEASPSATLPATTAVATLAPTVTPEPSPTATPTPGLPPAPQASTSYTLQAVLDYAAKTVQVDETVTYIHQADTPIQDLVFIVHAALFPFVFQYQTGTMDQQHLDTILEGNKLTAHLPAAINRGQSVTIDMTYLLALPDREGTLGFTARQVNLANWFPILAPYVDGQGWLVHTPGGFGEYTVFNIADFDVRLKVIGNGLVTAASASGEVDGEWLHYRLKDARNFVFSISPYFQVKDTIVGTTRISSYWFTDNASAGDTALQTTSQALSLFNDLFGVYPRDSLSVVESDFLQGMEYDGLFFLSRGFYENYPGTPQSNLVIIAAHETSHQWWYSLVANDQALEPWLDEGLATYCESLYYEKYYPDLVGWWWNNRVDFFAPSGWLDSDIYNPEGYEAYRNAVYLRGARFMDELRKTVGDEVFFKFLKTYASKYAYRIANGQDFFATLHEITPTDITPLTQQYFQKSVQ